ncbi:MAG TPA: hypothetical protein VK468_04545, partial [Pyrinomonadaceae bacterium]|nr:hypothetical protein [Pyrinomonadaceae bacterium]
MKKFFILSILAFTLIVFVAFRVSMNGGTSASPAETAPLSPPLTAKAAAFAESRPMPRRSSESDHRTVIPTVPPKTQMLGAASERAFSSLGERDASIAEIGGGQMPEPTRSFDGLVNMDNVDAFGLLILPPDMNGDVGPDHYVQIVNSLVRVYNKSGSPLTPPIKLSNIFAPLNTACAARNDGLPTVLYDPLAD